jgi:hypothetical protein
MLKYDAPSENAEGWAKWRGDKDKKRSTLMTEEEMLQSNYFISTLNNNVGSMQDKYAEWDEVEEYYGNDQEERENSPNSKMNALVASIEGMICQTVDREIQASCAGVSAEDNNFATVAKNGLNWILRNNKMRKKMSSYLRKIYKFGHGWLKVSFDHDYAGGFGLSKFETVPLNKLFIDTKIKDPLRINEAEYIVETVNLSRTFAMDVYGEKKANAIDYGFNQFRDNGVFSEAYSIDDDDSNWTLISWLSKCGGKLRLREITACGVLLYDSFKPGKRNIEQGRKLIPKSLYKYVNDIYPYFITTEYQLEGDLYGFGDGRLLIPVQKAINEIYDKIRIQMRPNTAGVDTYSGIDPDCINDNSFEPIPYDGARLAGRPPMYEFKWGSVNAEMFGLIEALRTEAQRVTRFSELMMGQAKAASTATEAAIQQEQGSSRIKYEKGNVEDTLADACKYALGLMMEFSKTGKSLRIEHPTGEKEYSWVDFREMAEVPVQMPTTQDYQDRYIEENPQAKPPEFMNVEENGKPVTRDLDLDIYISVGAGLPRNPAFVWSIVEKLSQLAVIDTDEQPPAPKPAISWSELREFMRNTLGIPIKDNEEMKKFVEEYRKIQAMKTKQMADRSRQAGGQSGLGGPPPIPGNEQGGLPPEGPGGPGGNQPMEQPETMGAVPGGPEEGGFNNPAGVGGIRNG